MKFFLHIGTEKTGSSFLQSLSARGRDELAQDGVWFARGSAYDERCMASGQISAGNGRDLAQRICQRRWTDARYQLNSAVSDANERQCGAVLFSSEWLLGAFAERALLEQFTAILRELGAEEIGFFLVLRDPVEQFLSLYKHRAKRGTVGGIAEWAQRGYRLTDELAGFRGSLREIRATLVVRKYRRDPGELEGLFFEQWLGMRVPSAHVPTSINPSLSLSEVECLRMLAERCPSLVVPLYDRLIALGVKEKVQGRELETYAQAIAERAVAADRDEWAAWNKLLAESEQLVIPQSEGELSAEPRELGFSKAQMEALMDLLSESVEPRFLARLMWSAKIRPVLSQARKMVFLRRT